MAGLEITVNIPAVVATFDAVKLKQVPFALSLALNTTSQLAREAQNEHMFREFNVRRAQRIRTAVRIRPSRKRDLVSRLTIQDAFLIQHEEGDTRKPGDVHSSIVKPVGKDQKRAGVIRGRNTPKALLEQGSKKIGRPRGAKSGGETTRRRPTPFVAKSKRTGKLGVYVRQQQTRAVFGPQQPGRTGSAGSGRYPIQLLFSFEKQARINARLKFRSNSEKTVQKVFNREFGKALAFALATAR